MATLGIHVYEKATSVSTPKVAKVGIPYVVGTAPVQSAEKPARANAPVLCTSWNEAVEKLGYSEDWKKFTLCEFMYSHFRLYGCQPVIFCNLLDPEAMKKAAEAKDHPVIDHQVILPMEVIAGSVSVKAAETGGDEAQEQLLAEDTDYSVFYDGDRCVVELLEGGAAYDAAVLRICCDIVTPDAVTAADVVEGIARVDAAMTVTGTVPDLICAPGWSHKTTVAAVMATKAAAISGLFGGKALIDIDSGTDGVQEYTELSGYKNKNNLVDENQILCWPMVRQGEHTFHLSTQLAGLMAQVDAGNQGIPYESPSNKNLRIDGCCLEDGTEVDLTWPQVELIAGDWGVVTAVNFPDSGWVAKGNYTACFPHNTDVKDQFIPVSRMFDYIRNTLIRTFWPRHDKPLTPVLRDSLLQTSNTWLGGLGSSGYLYGARCELLAEENPLTDLLAGHIALHVYEASPVPAQSVDFIQEYDVSYAEASLTA